jgi:LacI family transcriptional regulator
VIEPKRYNPDVIKRVTLSDVAKVCGVTPATVSRVLNDKAEFTASEAVRERILQTARKMGYVPDLAARNLNRQETHIIGVFASPYTHIAEGINESLLAGAASVLHPAGYDVFFEMSSAEKRKHALPFWRFDGALLIQQPKPETVQELDRRHVAYVCINEKIGKPAAYVLADDPMGMNMALDHLHQLGHSRIAYANAPSNYFSHYSVIDRYETLLSGVKERKMTLVEGHDQSPSSAGEFVEAAVSENGATAVISYDHQMAVKLVGAATAMNLRIPADFSLVCFNDVYPVGVLHPPLTVVAVSGREMGQMGADLLLNLLTSGKPGKGKEIRVPESLIVRGSTAPPKK